MICLINLFKNKFFINYGQFLDEPNDEYDAEHCISISNDESIKLTNPFIELSDQKK